MNCSFNSFNSLIDFFNYLFNFVPAILCQRNTYTSFKKFNSQPFFVGINLPLLSQNSLKSIKTYPLNFLTVNLFFWFNF